MEAWTQPLGAIAFLFTALGGQAVAQSQSPPRPPIRIATYNAENLSEYTGWSRMEALADNIERLNADLVFLQEVASAEALYTLQRELNKRQIPRYRAYEVDHYYRDQEVVLLSRVRVRRFRSYDFPGLSTLLDRAIYTDLSLFGSSFRIVAVHLKAGFYQYRDARTRNRQVRSLVRNLIQPATARGDHVVLLGDLNDHDPRVRYANGRRPHPSSQVFDILRRDASELRNTDEDLPIPDRRSSTMGYMYDHFLVDRRLAALLSVGRSRGFVRWASDHYPMVLDIHPPGTTRIHRVGESSSAIPANGTALSETLHVQGGGRVIRDVHVRLQLRHRRSKDLEVRLRHGGRTATLLPRANYRSWSVDQRVLTQRFAGLRVSGAWTLEVRYRGYGSVGGGRLERWELHTAASN